MALSAEKDSFAFSDFLTWETDERMEIIHGEVFMMAAPGTSHQLISGETFLSSVTGISWISMDARERRI